MVDNMCQDLTGKKSISSVIHILAQPHGAWHTAIKN